MLYQIFEFIFDVLLISFHLLYQFFQIFCLLQLFKLMQILSGPQKGIKNDLNKYNVLNFPDTNQLREIFSPSKELKIFYYAPKNTTLALSQFNVDKSKLKNNLEIFQWRNQTQFPIVKTSLVKIKQKMINETEVVCLSVYYQHCPLRINQIYEIPINQSIYLLKEALVGFQRLYNRYGGFDVQNSMIALNQKRKCKVWMNEEFYLNTCYKRDISQNKMVSKIIAIIQSHSQQSKTAKNFFLELRKFDTFLQSLRAVEFFIQSQKILVPNQFTKNQTMKIYQKVEYFTSKTTKQKPWNQFLNFRISLKQRKFNFYEESPGKEEKNNNRSPSFLKNRNNTNIKRSKSQKIVEMNTVVKNQKKQGENEPFFGTVGYFGSQMKYNTVKHPNHPIQSRKIENFSTCSSKLKINTNDIQMSKQQRKYSQAFKSKQMKSTFQSSNDYPQIIVKNYTDKSPSAYQYFSKASIDKPFYKEFEQLFKNNEEQSIVNPKNYVKEPIVYKSNGWINKVSGLMNSPGKLQTSYQQEQPYQIDTKRNKFNKINEISIFQIETQAHT